MLPAASGTGWGKKRKVAVYLVKGTCYQDEEVVKRADQGKGAGVFWAKKKSPRSGRNRSGRAEKAAVILCLKGNKVDRGPCAAES